MESLRAALRELIAGDAESALEHAVAAWREVREPRIAEVIDRISARVVAARGPLDGATLGARTKAWTKALETKSATDLGRMLAAPWPGKWQNALPLLEIVLQWPDDPRLATALTKLLLDQPYSSLTTHNFYGPVIAGIVRIADIRGREALEKAPRVYGAVPPSTQLAGVFARERPALSTDEAAALEEIERHFASDVRAAASKQMSEAEHLAGIYEHPEDPARKSVYADWLAERSDPRGELINLQLARREGRATDETRERERVLIDKHGAAWAGSLAQYFEPKPLLFEDGFFAGGVMKYVREQDIDGVLEDPAWRLVRVLEIRSSWVKNLLDHPKLSHLREVHGLNLSTAQEIASGPTRTLEVISFDSGYGGDDHAQVATCASLPRLRALSIMGSEVRFVYDAPVLSRLSRLGVERPSEQQWKLLAERGASLTEIEIANRSRRDAFLDVSGWRFRVTRAMPSGPFTAVEAQWILGNRAQEWDKVSGLTALLASIPADWLHTIVVRPSRALRLTASQLDPLREALARFPSLERLETPWDLAAPKVVVEAPKGPRLDVRVQCTGLLEESAAGLVFDLLMERGLVFDHFRVGYNSTARPLGKDPRAKFVQWAKNKRTERIVLFRDGQPGECDVARDRLSLEGIPAGSLDELLPWLERILAHGTVETGLARSGDDAWTTNDILWPYARIAFGRVTIVGGALVDRLDDDGLAELPVSAGDPRLRVRRSKGLLMLASEDATEERHVALAHALRALIDRRVRALRGYDPIEALAAGIVDAARALGLDQRRDEPQSWPINVSFSAMVDGTERLLHAGIRTPFEDPKLTVSLRSKADVGHWTRELVENVPVPTRAELEAALATASAKAREQAAAFFGDPEPKRRR